MSRSTGFTLFHFQATAAKQIADRFAVYSADPNRIQGKPEPFIQLLQAITGSGKTPMLAKAVDEMRLISKAQPIVLWVSKSRVVVGQTTTNLSIGGKYHGLVEDWDVIGIESVRPEDVLNEERPLIITGTVASFNVDDRTARRVFQDGDNGASVWESIERRAKECPLFIVYDEGHNSTDKQIDLLLELSPKAIILSSATMDLTPRISKYAENQKYTHDALAMADNQDPVVTWVTTQSAVDNQLVKNSIYLGGRSATPEHIIQEMYREFQALEKQAQELGLTWINPRCLYVSETNAVASRLGEEDDDMLDFKKRRARPIVIWRTLVEKCGVDPDDIAVYCSLKGKLFPREFHLFRGGEKDYEEFSRKAYKHIIFNLSLQEGFDSPECYFAYIDKEMGSRQQITQVIGRVLRQPGATYMPAPGLNTAHFFIRFQTHSEFQQALDDVQTEINGRVPQIKVTGNFNSPARPPLTPAKESRDMPIMAIRRDAAARRMEEKLHLFPDFRATTDAQGTGEASDVIVSTATGKIQSNAEVAYRAKGPGLPMAAGVYLRKKLEERNPEAVETVDFSQEADKLGAIVEMGSTACKMIDVFAGELSALYDEYVEIVPNRVDRYTIPPYQLRGGLPLKNFKYALHPHYDALNSEEEECARALDKAKVTWARNPSAGGYSVPLPVSGQNSRNFYPDFIAFQKEVIWLIDPKGDHLLRDAIQNKLLNIPKVRGVPAVVIVLIAKGKYEGLSKVGSDGITAFRRRSGNARPEHFDTYETCIKTLFNK